MAELLSIIVLSYKNGNLLFETLDSVMGQDYPNIEIVVCDDASPDFKMEQVETYIREKKGSNISNTVIIVNQQNVGTVKNLNIGIKASNGVFIKAIAGDDTLASADVCSRQIQYLNARQEVLFVTGNTVECDGEMNPVSMSGFLFDNDQEPLLRDNNKLLKYVTQKNQKALATQAMCFRREFFDENGFYNEEFLLIEDLPMAVRIVTDGMQIGYINMPCVKHRGQVGISTSNTIFDVRRLTYYKDLEKYYSISLKPIENKIGRTYVGMRHGVIRLRIEYCKLENASSLKKLVKIVRYSPYLAYYAVTQAGRVVFYMKK